MSFAEAVRSVFSKYAEFGGRARRSEYWWFTLFAVIVYVVADVIDAALNTPVIVFALVVAMLLPSIAVAVRRLHDTGRTGWWYLIVLVPLVGAIVMIVFAVQDSTGPNQWGPSPKQPAYGPGPAAGPPVY
ncbi:MAG: DUF805 domain-containing protein [Marmoricola sp.]